VYFVNTLTIHVSNSEAEADSEANTYPGSVCIDGDDITNNDVTENSPGENFAPTPPCGFFGAIHATCRTRTGRITYRCARRNYGYHAITSFRIKDSEGHGGTPVGVPHGSPQAEPNSCSMGKFCRWPTLPQRPPCRPAFVLIHFDEKRGLSHFGLFQG